jgi:maleylacetoacetate isomerase
LSRTLFGYWRSSAAYRVRIALGLKGLPYEPAMVDLRINRQSDAEYLRMNPQGMVPMLVDEGQPLTQSLAIIEYLDEVYPEPRLIPGDAVQRARIRSLAQVVACDIHPLNNLRVLKYLRKDLGLEEAGVNAWARQWIDAGFSTLETMLGNSTGQYLHGDTVTLADICLVPQMYNARRVETDLSRYPGLLALEERLQRVAAFDKARPENQPEATS